MDQLILPIAQELKINVAQVENTLKLLEEGNTVPFIARYRKEITKELDEEQILYIQKQYEYQVNLLKRKEDVIRLIDTQGKLTEDLKKEIMACEKLSMVDDIYRPYQQKRKTRASDAINKGLEPLSKWLLNLRENADINLEAKKYLNEEVLSVEDALQGAKDIIAELVSDNAKLRWRVQESIIRYGFIVTKKRKNAKDDNLTYKMYYDRSEKVAYIANHRVMAIDRAEKEKVITVTFNYDVEYLENYAFKGFIKNKESSAYNLLVEAIKDGLNRLLFPSVERLIRNDLSEKAQKQSIDIFSLNLEKLLLQPPVKSSCVLGFDPAFRTGCKLAVIDGIGNLKTIDVIYPHAPVSKVEESTKKLLKLIKDYDVKLIAIGNGTASRESESFVSKVIKDNNLNISYAIVSEAGASVYSASDIARDEFPNLQVEQRSAISIARRLLDPLSELIKIDPKSIGVGQYQHDLPKKQLNERLDFAILKSVNLVGVDLNTASKELLMRVSGLNKSIATSIIEHRGEIGKFKDRKQLLKVKKLGSKTFEQCAGFLRISDGDEVLDKTGIHPESYDIAKTIMKKYQVKELGQKIDVNLDDLSNELNVDKYTLKDIVDTINQPLRDYRDKYDAPLLRQDILEIKDLKVGDKMYGTVRNVVDFGAFIDIGLHEDGLLHVSKMNKARNIHPSEILSVGDVVQVWISDINVQTQKVQLSLIQI
ncbi:MAG: RNA-binding transcriptional accessory protein [Erysipelotrichaceae bacterium]|nr:RNA-binding transcriptional accessory protein [Erysipelotrichaceae bacterium]